MDNKIPLTLTGQVDFTLANRIASSRDDLEGIIRDALSWRAHPHSQQKDFAVGNIVTRRDGSGFSSGSCYDHYAVVIGLEPFVCVSEDGDMRWSKLTPDELCFVGYAKDEDVKRYMRRLEK